MFGFSTPITKYATALSAGFCGDALPTTKSRSDAGDRCYVVSSRVSLEERRARSQAFRDQKLKCIVWISFSGAASSVTITPN